MNGNIQFFVLVVIFINMITAKLPDMLSKSRGPSCLSINDRPMLHVAGSAERMRRNVESNKFGFPFDRRKMDNNELPDISHPVLSLKARVNQQEASQETLIHASSEDNSQLTVSRPVIRYQSNDFIEASDLNGAFISISARANA